MFGVKNAAISIKYFAARSGSGATIYINDRPVPLLAGENPEYQSPLSPMTCKVFGEYFLIGEISGRLPFLAGITEFGEEVREQIHVDCKDTFICCCCLITKMFGTNFAILFFPF